MDNETVFYASWDASWGASQDARTTFLAAHASLSSLDPSAVHCVCLGARGSGVGEPENNPYKQKSPPAAGSRTCAGGGSDEVTPPSSFWVVE